MIHSDISSRFLLEIALRILVITAGISSRNPTSISSGISVDMFQRFSAGISLIITVENPPGIPGGFLAAMAWRNQKKIWRISARNVYRSLSSLIVKQSQQ